MELNGLMELPPHPIPDCETVINGVAGWNVLSSIDVKVAYNNFPIEPACQPYCVIMTQDQVYVYQEIRFGLNIANYHFQYAICDILNHPHP